MIANLWRKSPLLRSPRSPLQTQGHLVLYAQSCPGTCFPPDTALEGPTHHQTGSFWILECSGADLRLGGNCIETLCNSRGLPQGGTSRGEMNRKPQTGVEVGYKTTQEPL